MHDLAGSCADPKGFARQMNDELRRIYEERKSVLRSWVDKVKLVPESLAIEIDYQVPEPVANSMGAGTLSVAMHQVLAQWLVRRIALMRNGRRKHKNTPRISQHDQ